MGIVQCVLMYKRESHGEGRASQAGHHLALAVKPALLAEVYSIILLTRPRNPELTYKLLFIISISQSFMIGCNQYLSS